MGGRALVLSTALLGLRCASPDPNANGHEGGAAGEGGAGAGAPGDHPAIGACFYDEKGFTGDRFCVELTGFTTDVVNLSALGAQAVARGGAVASVEVFGKIAVTLYEGEFGQGASAVVTESAASLPAPLTGAIASLELADVNECDRDNGGCGANEVCTNQVDGHACAPAEICFYEGPGLRGAKLCAGPAAGHADLPAELDGKVSSIEVKGPIAVTVYQDKGGQGAAATFTGTVDLAASPQAAGFDDAIRSFAVNVPGRDAIPQQTTCKPPATRPPATSNRVALQRAYDVDWVAPTSGAFSPTAPGRLYITEKTGTVSFADPQSTQKTVALDIAGHTHTELDAGVLTLVFSPSFASDGDLYVLYNRTCFDVPPGQDHNPACPDPGGFVSRIARFHSADGGVTFDPASEEVILDSYNYDSNNHTFGGMVFGPDGMLYVGTGDGGNGCFVCQAHGQDLTSLRGKILRLDVTTPPVQNGATRPGCVANDIQRYCVPADNPFAGNSQGYSEEIWAYGMRNPWKVTFDGQGRLWAGDVGQDTWEEVDLIEKGMNYGWAVMEGPDCFNGGEPPTGAPPCNDPSFRPPVAYYNHADAGNAVTGGYVYRGANQALRGAFVFADFVTHHVWALWPDGRQVDTADPLVHTAAGTTVERLFTTDELVDDASLFVPAFVEAPDGELYIVMSGEEWTFNGSVGQIYKLIPPAEQSWGDFPTKLSDTGCFTKHPLTGAYSVPSPELLPYEINAPFWSDGATKRRWLSVPEGADGSPIPAGVSAADGDIDFPAGTVLAKEFRLEGRRIETRLLMRHDDGVWGGYTYRWRDDQTDADLVRNGEDAAWGALTWNYPTRAECLRCHGASAGRSLGPELRQLERTKSYLDGRPGSQVDTLAYLGVVPWPYSAVRDMARFHLDEGSGGIAHDATATFPEAPILGVPRWIDSTVQGRAVTALSFDGGSYIETQIPNGSTRTLAAWIRPTSSDPVPFIESVIDSDVPGEYGSGFGVNGGEIVAILDNDFWFTGVRVRLNAWQHIALSFDAQSATLYVDGVSAASFAYAQGDVTQAPYFIGKSHANDLYFHGQIYDVRVFDAALSSTDVSLVYQDKPLSALSISPLPDPYDASAAGIEARARAWLHTNCSGCHRPGGNGQGGLDLRFDTPFPATHLCNVEPQYGAADIPLTTDPKLLVPGAPARSVLFARIQSVSDKWRMPPISSHVAEEKGVSLIAAWINALPACP